MALFVLAAARAHTHTHTHTHTNTPYTPHARTHTLATSFLRASTLGSFLPVPGLAVAPLFCFLSSVTHADVRYHAARVSARTLCVLPHTRQRVAACNPACSPASRQWSRALRAAHSSIHTGPTLAPATRAREQTQQPCTHTHTPGSARGLAGDFFASCLVCSAAAPFAAESCSTLATLPAFLLACVRASCDVCV